MDLSIVIVLPYIDVNLVLSRYTPSYMLSITKPSVVPSSRLFMSLINKDIDPIPT